MIEMKIEIISVSAVSEGAEMLITLQISGDDGNRERRKMLLFTNQYLELGLRKGMLIDENAFNELEKCSKECLAIRKGSDLLSYSSSSKKRLIHRLRNKGIDKESAENAAQYLEDVGAINEESEVENQVDMCLRKLFGKKRIYRELLAKGYKSEHISNALASITEEQLIENCATLLQKKHKTIPDDPGVRKKIAGSLARYGYGFYEIKCAFDIVLNKKAEI